MAKSTTGYSRNTYARTRKLVNSQFLVAILAF